MDSIVDKSNRNYEQIKKIKLHKHWIYTVLILQDGRLASASGDSSIKIFEMNSFSLQLTIKEHTKNVTYIIQLKNGYLLSCSWDGTINVYSINLNSYTLINTIEDDRHVYVWSLVSISSDFFGSSSNKIKIWENVHPFECAGVIHLNSNRVWIYALLSIKDTLISGCNDSILRFYSNQKPYELKKTIEKVYTNLNNALYKLNDEHIIVGGQKFFSIINISTYQIISRIGSKAFPAHSFLQINMNTLLLGAQEGKLFIFDINTLNLISQSKPNEETITCLLRDSKSPNIFYSVSLDGYLIKWKI